MENISDVAPGEQQERERTSKKEERKRIRERSYIRVRDTAIGLTKVPGISKGRR